MSELLQTGQHPDADQLSAFVEHVLPAHEQEGMLAHLAVCADCRTVVALSMPPAEELPEVQPVPVRRFWPRFGGWNLVWPVAVAFAALVLVVLQVSKRAGSAPPTQVAEAHRPEEPAVAEGVPAAQPAPRPASPALPSRDRVSGAVQAARSAAANAPAARTEDQSVTGLPLASQNVQPSPNPAVAQRQVVAGAMGRASAPVLPPPQQPLGSASGGTVAAGVISMARPVPAPPASAVVVPPPAAPPPPPAVALASPAAAPATVISGGAMDLSVEPDVNASAAVVSKRSLAGFGKAANVGQHPLPSGLPAVSTVTAGQTMLAIDSGNTLFLSSDAGAHWRPVRAAWKGRAVKVALAVTPAAARPLAVMGSGSGGASTGVYGGSGQSNLNENYVDGVPMTNISSQGDPAPIQNGVSVDAAPPAVGGRASGGATLTGVVTDVQGAAIAGAAVTLSNTATGAAVTLTTDASGRYSAAALAPGKYRIDASARGFQKLELNVTLAASRPVTANITLQVGQASEVVDVMADAVAIQTESSANSTAVLKSKSAQTAAPVFAVTTDAGERWVSADGQSWKRE